MTKLSDSDRCGWCNRPVAQSPGPGRRRRFCCRSHRQRAYEARLRSDSLGIPDGQVVVAEVDLAKLHDRLYRLESAVEDVDADLARNAGPKAYRDAFEHLCDPARDLVGMVVEPLRE